MLDASYTKISHGDTSSSPELSRTFKITVSVDLELACVKLTTYVPVPK
jgi:hypothetical protein